MWIAIAIAGSRSECIRLELSGHYVSYSNVKHVYLPLLVVKRFARLHFS